jgi:hypothetical protein
VNTVALANRQRLPNRRASISFDFECGPHRYVATASFFPRTNRLAEIFLGNGRAGSDVDTAAKDSAVVASIALQHGVPLPTIRKALLRDPRGLASSPPGRGARSHCELGERAMNISVTAGSTANWLQWWASERVRTQTNWASLLRQHGRLFQRLCELRGVSS